MVRSPPLREASPRLPAALPTGVAATGGDSQGSRMTQLQESLSRALRAPNLAAQPNFLPDDPPPLHRPRSSTDRMLSEPVLSSNSLTSAGRSLVTHSPRCQPFVISVPQEPQLPYFSEELQHRQSSDDTAFIPGTVMPGGVSQTMYCQGSSIASPDHGRKTEVQDPSDQVSDAGNAMSSPTSDVVPHRDATADTADGGVLHRRGLKEVVISRGSGSDADVELLLEAPQVDAVSHLATGSLEKPVEVCEEVEDLARLAAWAVHANIMSAKVYGWRSAAAALRRKGQAASRRCRQLADLRWEERLRTSKAKVELERARKSSAELALLRKQQLQCCNDAKQELLQAKARLEAQRIVCDVVLDVVKRVPVEIEPDLPVTVNHVAGFEGRQERELRRTPSDQVEPPTQRNNRHYFRQLSGSTHSGRSVSPCDSSDVQSARGCFEGSSRRSRHQWIADPGENTMAQPDGGLHSPWSSSSSPNGDGKELNPARALLKNRSAILQLVDVLSDGDAELEVDAAKESAAILEDGDRESAELRDLRHWLGEAIRAPLVHKKPSPAAGVHTSAVVPPTGSRSVARQGFASPPPEFTSLLSMVLKSHPELQSSQMPHELRSAVLERSLDASVLMPSEVSFILRESVVLGAVDPTQLAALLSSDGVLRDCFCDQWFSGWLGPYLESRREIFGTEPKRTLFARHPPMQQHCRQCGRLILDAMRELFGRVMCVASLSPEALSDCLTSFVHVLCANPEVQARLQHVVDLDADDVDRLEPLIRQLAQQTVELNLSMTACGKTPSRLEFAAAGPTGIQDDVCKKIYDLLRVHPLY